MIKKGTTSIAEIKKGTISIGSVYKGYDLVFESWKTLTTQGIPPLTVNASGKNLLDYKIYGNSVQNGTPTPTNPVEIQSVGDLITDSQDENYGKYKILVTASDGVNSTTVNIYLDEPLRKVGNYADYIDFENQKIVRNVGKEIFNGNENWGSYATGNGYRLTNTYFLDNNPVMCNLFENTQSLVTTKAIRKNFSNIYVYGMATDYPTVNDLLAFLQTNNMEVIGALTTPTEESVVLPNIPTIKGTTIFTVGTTIQPSDMYVKYKGKI